ncbi:MAG: NB-ARC domain-containing protein [Candidatus Hodarchaeales archaeon]
MCADTSIIVDPEAFSKATIPEKVRYRDKEKAELLSGMRNFANTVIVGEYGSGKTVLIKDVIKEYNDLREGRAVYINCAIYQTTYSILKEVLPKGDLIVYRSNYELIRELRKYIKTNKMIVVLDNFEQLKDSDLITRFMSLGVCVFLLTDNEENLTNLDTNIRSNISKIMTLPKYSTDQALDILKAVAGKALEKETFSDEILKEIAKKTEGNITLAINALKAAAMKAESEGQEKILMDDIQVEDNPPVNGLNLDHKIIIDIMKEWKHLPASRLYQLYLERVTHPKGERAFRNYVHELCVRGVLGAIGAKKGRFYEYIGDESE